MSGVIGAAALALFLVALEAPVLRAQEQEDPKETVGRAAPTAPLLPPDHWALDALRRAHALGLADGYLPPMRGVPRSVVGRHLALAADSSAGTRWERLATGWLDRFREEFPEAAAGAPDDGPLALLGGSAAAGYLRETGRSAPGLGEYPPDFTGTLALPDRHGPLVGTEIAAQVGRRAAVLLAPRLGPEEAELARWDIRLGLGRWAVAVGREPVGYGAGVGGGVVLSGSHPLERIELGTPEPLRLPGFLSHLGPLVFHTFFARLPEERHPGRPVFWGASGSFRPHPRLTLSAHRGALFGGAGTPVPVTPWRVVQALVGIHAGVENQIVAAEAVLRLPTERWVPLTAHCEWGAEDSAGAWFAVPGIVCGAWTPAVPGLPGLALGAEHARFGARRDGNPAWYRHHMFPGSWAVDEATLGHPVGGEGAEWLGWLRGSAADARLEVEGRAFARERVGENLFVPGRAGDSFGVAATARWRVSSGAELLLSAGRESGAGWTETSLLASTRLFF